MKVLVFMHADFVTTCTFTVLVDLTSPMTGEVVDGKEASFTDVQYTTSRAKVEVQWRGYSDPESFINNYQVQVHRARYNALDEIKFRGALLIRKLGC